jgi:acetyl esterase/lipase
MRKGIPCHLWTAKKLWGLALACVLPLAWCESSALRADDAAAVHNEAETIELWPQGAPGKVGDEPADHPWLWAYPAQESNRCGTAVVVCPGGGYGMHAVDHEGTQVARWFNSFGVSAYVLKYRLAPRYRHPAPMQDVQRAIQYVRAHAEQLGIVPERIGVIGFSAGGHLASTAATHLLPGDPQSDDVVSKQSSRPDFAILAYPVISMTAEWGHGGSKRNLLGENPSAALAELMSNEQQVSAQTPPTFLFHTGADTGVPPQNSVAFYSACLKHNVPAELHIYNFGPHGVGLAPGDAALSSWKHRLFDWLRDSGFLATATRSAVEGTVTRHGQPLKWGQVRFTPESPVMPVAFAMVHNGQFRIPTERGPVRGPQQVSVFDMGDIVPRPTVSDAVQVKPALSIQIGEDRAVVKLELPE